MKNFPGSRVAGGAIWRWKRARELQNVARALRSGTTERNREKQHECDTPHDAEFHQATRHLFRLPYENGDSRRGTFSAFPGLV